VLGEPPADLRGVLFDRGALSLRGLRVDAGPVGVLDAGDLRQCLRLDAGGEEPQVAPDVVVLDGERRELVLLSPALAVQPGGGVARQPVDERPQPAAAGGIDLAAEVQPVVALEVCLDQAPARG
jgi:hypothetical protein